jgi:alpha-beta hydrolase superfamily lysophospholipase
MLRSDRESAVVSHRFYPEARHELFNEINRDEVTRDVLAWLKKIIG